MNKVQAAKILLQRNFYSKKLMSSSTRKLYESYGLSKKEENSILGEIYETLKKQCVSVDDSMPFYNLSSFIKEYKYYSKLNEMLSLIDSNKKNRSTFGLLNLYESVFQLWYLNEDQEKLGTVSEYLIDNLQELSYILTMNSEETVNDNWTELDIENQEEFVFNRCNQLLNVLKN